MKQIDHDAYFQVLDKTVKGVPALIKFEASWCKPCQRMTPIIQAVLDRANGEFEAFTADVEKSPELAAMFGVRTVPAFVLLAKGHVAAWNPGSMSKPQLEAFVGQVLG